MCGIDFEGDHNLVSLHNVTLEHGREIARRMNNKYPNRIRP